MKRPALLILLSDYQSFIQYSKKRLPVDPFQPLVVVALTDLRELVGSDVYLVSQVLSSGSISCKDSPRDRGWLVRAEMRVANCQGRLAREAIIRVRELCEGVRDTDDADEMVRVLAGVGVEAVMLKI